MSVRGILSELSDSRLVFVGRSANATDGTFYIAFRNAEGYETKLHLSGDAGELLAASLRTMRDPDKGSDTFPFDTYPRWEVVKEGEAAVFHRAIAAQDGGE